MRSVSSWRVIDAKILLMCMSHWSRGMSMASDSAEDLQELQRLLGEAKRPRVQALLSTEITNLEKVSLSVTDAVQFGCLGVF